LKFGIALENFSPPGKSPSKSSILEMATTAENLGFDSLWVWDHLLLGSRKVFPVIDSLTTLSFLSGKTSRIKLGTSVLIMALRNPLALAKALSAIQIYSDGRLIVGTAAGWYEREFVASGVEFKKRGRIFEDEFKLVKRLLNEADVNYKSDNILLEHATIEPKSHIPIPMLIGGYSNIVLDRAGRLGDGWISYYYSPVDYFESWNKVILAAKGGGRGVDKLNSVNVVPLAIASSFEKGDAISRDFTSRYMDLPKNTRCSPDSSVRGSRSECISQIEKYEQMGVKELVFIPSNYDIQQVENAGKEILPSFAK
jgi:alkanesulfonate monooxygenase SsuD/methylene tetrahydromethanopterin reductase-like flavin-dependent oxidoreductase (luciferase family)